MNELRSLPSVDRLISELPGDPTAPHALLVEAARSVLDRARAAIRADEREGAPTLAALVAMTMAALHDQLQPSLRPVINASGVILQTNLGRAPLSENALAAIRSISAYSNLEFHLEAGERGSRHDHAGRLIRETTGAEDAIVVNNNAAALFFVLSAFATAREVVVSRGQAVEIGGGFRIPDVIRQSGASLVEVGTTNRTYGRDYEEAASAESAAILRVHASNFQVIGFTAEPMLDELAAIARKRNVLLIDDLGSGCFVDTTAYGLRREPTVRESIEAGADLVLFSGDKLLGGPQCGIIAGRADLIGRLKKHPLARVLRVDKTTVAALEATLLSYVRGAESTEIPVWRMLSQELPDLQRRLIPWEKSTSLSSAAVESRTMVGGGSLPGASVPTWCLAINFQSNGETAFATALRQLPLPVVARIESGAVLLDPRTVDPADDAIIAFSLGLVSAAR